MAPASAQNATVSGVVTGAKGEPVIGANIIVEGTTQGVSTDAMGAYTLGNVPADATLMISYLGYKPVKIQVAGRTKIDVALEEEAEEIEGVMVVAYGTAKKESFTGSAAVIKGDDLQKRVVGNLTKSLEGLVSGVQVTSGGGQPGEGSSFMIRGMGSINAVATPLIVVDGIPYDGSLSSINPADIESSTVLKDASAGALYGSRGGNGVLIITTKKGKKDRIRVSYKGNVGIASRALKRYDLLNMQDYVELNYEALRNSAQYSKGMDFESASRDAAANLGQHLGGLKSPEYYNPYKNYSWETLIDQSTGKIRPNAKAAWNENWMDEITDESAVRTEHIVSVNGGSERTNYLVSLGYYKEDGILQNTDFNRYTGRVSVDTQAKDWFKIGMSANFAHTNSDYQSFTGSSTSNVWYTAQFMGPIYPVYLKDIEGQNVYKDGKRMYEYGEVDENGYANRPTAQGYNSKAELFNNKAYYQRNSLSARGHIALGTVNEAAKLYGLKLTVSLGTDFNDYQRTIVYNKYYGNAKEEGGRIGKTNSRTLSYTFNQLLTYDRTFGDHSINLLLGHEYYRYKYNYAMGEKTGIVEGIDELDPAVTTTDNRSYTDNYAIESVLSRLNYGFKNRYYIDASWRTDGSSRFKRGHQWGNFWSVGASWRISEESFLKDVDWLDNLTLKASYGVQGNDNVNTYYAWQSNYELTWPNAENPGAIMMDIGNDRITWEKNGNLNTGIEASMFGGRLVATLEYYTRKTTDMLLNRPMALSTGFKSYRTNIGSMRNQGFEAMLRGRIFDKPNFRWEATLMGAMNRNKVLEVTKDQNYIDFGIQRVEVGKPLFTFYMPKAAGVDPATGKQLYHAYWTYGYDDQGNRKLVECDEYITDDVALATPSKYYHGSREPKVYGSIGSNFVVFKNIDISFLTTYSIGGKVYDGLYYSSMYVQYAGNNWHKNVKRRWQKPGDRTDVPMLEIGGTYAPTNNSLIDASYFAIKNITIGYTLPKRWLRKLDVESLRIYASFDNIAMFNHMNGMDPQQSFTGNVAYTYAPSRVIAFGLDLNF
jgi:tonB-linked outer membrane protein, susC/ragA family